MEQQNYYLYVTFPSVHNGLTLEARLKEEEIPFAVVPTPREISKCCGISIRFMEEWQETILTVIKKNAIKISGIYKLEVNSELKKFKFV